MDAKLLLIVCLVLLGTVKGYTLREILRERGENSLSSHCTVSIHVCLGYVCMYVFKQFGMDIASRLFSSTRCCSEPVTKKTFCNILLPLLSYCFLWCRLTSILYVSHLKCLRRSCTDLGNIELFCSSEKVGRIRFKSTVRRRGNQRYVVQ